MQLFKINSDFIIPILHQKIFHPFIFLYLKFLKKKKNKKKQQILLAFVFWGGGAFVL
jgi:hypothetical protein